MHRRTFLLAPAALTLGFRASAGTPDYPQVVNGHALAFPRDYGAHPRYRTEWWYATGWLETASSPALGFQVTFFRSRPFPDDANPSRFAPSQLLFAHVALSDPRVGSLQHDQRAARTGFGLADASEADTDVHLGDWSLRRDANGHYRVSIATPDFTFAFAMHPAQPVLLNGSSGYSRKGPLASEASYYYSEPWLHVTGTLLRRDRRYGPTESQTETVRGRAWLDHEWSSAPLDDNAVGWDWIGIDLDDGGALMAFEIRDNAGRKFWAGGTLRDRDGNTRALAPESVRFTPLRWWRSPHTDARYPVAMRVDAGDMQLLLAPLMDDQELDSRASTGAVYWEGAVTAFEAPRREPAARAASEPETSSGNDARAGRKVGLGYLELTGYFRRLDL
ncbi:carotenoid 1,2-hydratase [Burkholderia sp. Ac-20353]|uniref:lipocalin-like domain-containing protein n=1 Tax=Burkholderia sp. Ac-20353 TaxID=2703894 RepID=UPI00197C2764|nr:carotenoid 1,2-hydratase [Burkholderia sp. Ac-20353]MBN3791897.1 carotenoid 1,2-hydratase [Burkholderia sp. Ac-20353]